MIEKEITAAIEEAANVNPNEIDLLQVVILWLFTVPKSQTTLSRLRATNANARRSLDKSRVSTFATASSGEITQPTHSNQLTNDKRKRPPIAAGATPTHTPHTRKDQRQ